MENISNSALVWGSAAYPAFAANTDNTTGDTGQYGTLSMPFQGEYLVYEPTITDV